MHQDKKVISIITAVTLMSLGHNGSERFFSCKCYNHSEIKIWSECTILQYFKTYIELIINTKVG